MVDTRESRASATEVKFVIDTATGTKVREWARTRLQPDPHGTGPHADEYLTSSLYFDTDRFDVFERRGSFGRAKFRIRRYSGASYAFLERKLRRPNLLVKRRTQVPLDVIDAIERGAVAHDAPGAWFRERLQVRQLSPACVVSYHRTARGIDTPGGFARLTIDDGLHVAPADGFSLPDAALNGSAILSGSVILELKYRGAMPPIFQDLVQTFRLQTQPASKYRLAMAALGHVLADANGRPTAAVS